MEHLPSHLLSFCLVSAVVLDLDMQVEGALRAVKLSAFLVGTLNRVIRQEKVLQCNLFRFRLRCDACASFSCSLCSLWYGGGTGSFQRICQLKKLTGGPAVINDSAKYARHHLRSLGGSPRVSMTFAARSLNVASTFAEASIAIVV